ncbi:helix-turn-helix transcriptional regulator [Variovorax sp. DXTD-1]|uniref:helix-turn-helix transcriptional regulator n=1 Tax=Variovorax sp. DXTD-1 TaxID=2495592 RepID=UPI0021AEA813|nr:AlpA family phage regulatory protein [Variovorax sp. DXTD-1]
MALPYPTTSPHAMSSPQTLLQAMSPAQDLQHAMQSPQPPLRPVPPPMASRDERVMDLVLEAKSLALMRRPKVLALTGWSKSTLANRVDAGDFPAPVPSGPRTVGWVEAEVIAWLEARIRERDARIEKQKAFDQNTQGMRGAHA